MFESILVGTDGSGTAGEAVAQAVRLASALGARLQIVTAYEPVPERRLRIERVARPDRRARSTCARRCSRCWTRRGEDAAAAGVTRVETFARVREMPRTRSSTSPRSRAPT